MSDSRRPHRPRRPLTRPTFPRRAVITGGMPYGNKSLHFGHIGGVFIPADILARFLRDRIGAENVIFVSGTDCYGSPIVEHHRKLVEKGELSSSLEEFVRGNHEDQKRTLAAYGISPNLFAASGLDRAAELHVEISHLFFKTLLENGHLLKLVVEQFYDSEQEKFLNGRQVTGRCPIQGCASERGYADECSLGHQYMVRDLISPRSTLSGKPPELREVTNWCVNLPAFRALLESWLEQSAARPGARRFTTATIREFFQPPVLHVVKRDLEALEAIRADLPAHTQAPGQGKSVMLTFECLADRERACAMLGRNSIQFRSGKTLVPFRLSGNCAWGVPVPDTDGLSALTFWVWPESLWAPISFTAAVLEARGEPKDSWRDWWCSKDAEVYQFIGEDNVYFYGPAEMAMFLGMQGTDPVAEVPEGQLQLPDLIVNRHVLFLDKKASSSGKIRPPMASELLDHYTPTQLRAHFINLGLGARNVSFRPKPYDPTAQEKAADPVLKESKLLSSVFNRLARSSFYGCQKHTEGRIPVGPVSAQVLAEARAAIIGFESAMSRKIFHQALGAAERFIRASNKAWNRESRSPDPAVIRQLLIDTFHRLRVATVLMHSIAPEGCEKIRQQLDVGEEFWSWEHIFEPVYFFMDDPETHQPKTLAPRVDFFENHPSQRRG